MAFDTSTASNILKINYQGPIRKTLNSATYFLTKLRKNTDEKTFNGKQVYMPIHKGRNLGTGTRLESGIGTAGLSTLPVAGSQQYDQAVYNVKYNYGAIELTGPAIAAAKSNVGSFARGIQSEMEGLAEDLKVNQNRQLWHDGSSFLCSVVASDSLGTNSTTNARVSTTKFLQVGQTVDFRVKTNGTSVHASHLSVVILTIPDAYNFTFAAITTAPAATEAVLGILTRDPAAWGGHTEMWGLEAIVSGSNPTNGLTDFVGGPTLDRLTANFWRSRVIANGGVLRPLTLDLMQQAWDATEIESDMTANMILTSYAAKRRYGGLLVADKRYPASGETKLDGGYSGLDFNGVPVVADKDASPAVVTTTLGTTDSLNKLYFLTMRNFELQVLEDWQWIDEGGSVLKQKPDSGAYKDAYIGYMKSYMELGTNRPNSCAVLADIDENP